MDLVLASTSAYRRALLQRLGVPFRTIAPAFDERSIERGVLNPSEFVALLAESKAASVRDREPASCVIGGDQAVVLDDKILGKPGSRGAAIAQLELLSGRTHELITCVATGSAGVIRSLTDVSHLTMRDLSGPEIGRYVDLDRPFDCAGSYKIESRGICLFERIETADFTAIEGMPLIGLARMLRELGYLIP